VPAGTPMAERLAALVTELERVSPDRAAAYPGQRLRFAPTAAESELIAELDLLTPNGHRFGRTEGGALGYFAGAAH
jgi:hypothetical protein